MWLVLQDKILTKENLLKKDWHGDNSCPFCGAFETSNNLFVTCPLNSENTNPGHDLEGYDLSEYLRVQAKIEDIDVAFQSIGNQDFFVPLSSSSKSAATNSFSIDSSMDPV